MASNSSSTDKEEDESEFISKLFIGGLSQQTNEDIIRRHFETFGSISDVKVLYDKATDRSRYVYS